jgi:hypothetical protein
MKPISLNLMRKKKISFKNRTLKRKTNLKNRKRKSKILWKK